MMSITFDYYLLYYKCTQFNLCQARRKQLEIGGGGGGGGGAQLQIGGGGGAHINFFMTDLCNEQ